jgi:hypothetical protein
LKKEDIPVPSLELRAEISDKAVVEDGILPGDSLSLTITLTRKHHDPSEDVPTGEPGQSQLHASNPRFHHRYSIRPGDKSSKTK